MTAKYPIVRANKALLSVFSQKNKTKMRKNVNGINIENLMLIFLMTHAIIGFASLPPYFVKTILVVMPSSMGKIKNAMPKPMFLIQFGILKSRRKLNNRKYVRKNTKNFEYGSQILLTRIITEIIKAKNAAAQIIMLPRDKVFTFLF